MYNQDFSFMMRERQEKPRDRGVTMILGEAVYTTGGLNYLEDILQVNGPWIDWYKFVWSSFPLQPGALVDKKIGLLNDNDVLSFVGGNLFEEAIAGGYVDEFLDALCETQCPGMEVSTTIIDISLKEKAELIEKAADRGLHVHGEIGRKKTETGAGGLTLEEVREDLQVCLDAGADIVVLETEEVEEIFGDDGEITDGESMRNLRSLLDEIGRENILFEVPISSDMHEVLEVTGWFIDNVGHEVNLGNVNPYLISMVEQQRRSIGAHQN
jgi:phosphosulfolactate synthase